MKQAFTVPLALSHTFSTAEEERERRGARPRVCCPLLPQTHTHTQAHTYIRSAMDAGRVQVRVMLVARQEKKQEGAMGVFCALRVFLL